MTSLLLLSHGFSPQLIRWMLLLFSLLDGTLFLQASYHARKECRPIHPVRKGYKIVGGFKQNYVSELGHSKSLEDCIKSSCNVKNANYAFFENGQCYALRCKAHKCQIEKNSHGKGQIVGLLSLEKKSHASKSQRWNKAKGNSKLHASRGGSLKNATDSVDSLQVNGSAQNVNSSHKQKTNESKIIKSDQKSFEKQNTIELSEKDQKLNHTEIKSLSAQNSLDAKTNSFAHRAERTHSNVKNSRHASKKGEHKKSLSLNWKHTKRRHRSKEKTKSLSNNKNDGRTNHKIVNIASKNKGNSNSSSGRFTRDYPYLYSQYEPVSRSLYSTQETDWRRNNILESPDTYNTASYDDLGTSINVPEVTSSDLRSRLEMQRLRDRNLYTSQMLPLPLTDIVRRQNVPHSNRLALSVVNDMLPDSPMDTVKSYVSLNNGIGERIRNGHLESEQVVSDDLRKANIPTGSAMSLIQDNSNINPTGNEELVLPGNARGSTVLRSSINPLERTSLNPIDGSTEALKGLSAVNLAKLENMASPTRNSFEANRDLSNGQLVYDSTGQPFIDLDAGTGGQKTLQEQLNLATQDDLSRAEGHVNGLVGNVNSPSSNPKEAMTLIPQKTDITSKSSDRIHLVGPTNGFTEQSQLSSNVTLSQDPSLTLKPNSSHVVGLQQGSMLTPAMLQVHSSTLPRPDLHLQNKHSASQGMGKDIFASSYLTSEPSVSSAAKLSASSVHSVTTSSKIPVQASYTDAVGISPSTSLASLLSKTVSTLMKESSVNQQNKLAQTETDQPFQHKVHPYSKEKEFHDNTYVDIPKNRNVSSDVNITASSPLHNRNATSQQTSGSVDIPFPTRLVLPEPSPSSMSSLSGVSTNVLPTPSVTLTTPLTETVSFDSLTAEHLSKKISNTESITLTNTLTAFIQPTPPSTYLGQTSTGLHDMNTGRLSSLAAEGEQISNTPMRNNNMTQYIHKKNGTESMAEEADQQPTLTTHPLHSAKKLRTTSRPTTRKASTKQPGNTGQPATGDKFTQGYQTRHPTTTPFNKHNELHQRPTTSTFNRHIDLHESTAFPATESTEISTVLPTAPTAQLHPTSPQVKAVGNISLLSTTQNPTVSSPSDAMETGKLNLPTVGLHNTNNLHEQSKINDSQKHLPVFEAGRPVFRLKYPQDSNALGEGLDYLADSGHQSDSGGCNSPLGISSGIIPDDQMTASSQLSSLYSPGRGRLGLHPDLQGNAGGWCADSDLLNVTQYLQIDFGSKQSICRIATQGQHEQPNWVTHYKLGYSDDGQHWTIYQEKAKDKIFVGNTGQDDYTSRQLLNPILARYIRFYPETWHGVTMCMRVELYENSKGGENYLSGRSNIPGKHNGLIEHLSFEKQDDTMTLDSSPMGNNAYLNEGAAVYDSHSSCRHAVRIGKGSEVLLDGKNMRVKPRDAITISAWVKLDRIEGVHSVFDTIGSHSMHNQGQYHFEVVGGAVRWFHRNESGAQIFSAITNPKTLSPDQWTHLVVTYDSSIEKAKIYIDGQRAAEGDGKGLLSQDWGARVGIGRHKDTRDLQGDVDEFSIYDVALPGEKILELTRKCDFEKYYCGSTLTAQKGILVSPDYPGSHKGAVECVWEIEGQQGEIIALNLKEMDINGDKDCNNSRVQVRDRENSTVIGNFCGEEDDRRVESHGNHMWIKFESNGKTKGERFRIEYEREPKRSTRKSTMSSNKCHGLDVLTNVTLVGGSKAGTYTDLGTVDGMKSCLTRCCNKATCEVAFMIDYNCYAVHCFDQGVCRLRRAKASSLNPMISFTVREGVPTRVKPMFASDNSASPAIDKSCSHSDVHDNVTLIGGIHAGNFTSHGITKSFDECLSYCCKSDQCDAAFMVKKTCFSVKCADNALCKFKKAKPSPYNPTLAYVNREKKKLSPEVTSPGNVKSIEDSTAHKTTATCSNARVSKIYRDVTLKGGISAGEFNDKGNVKDINECANYCCGDDNCNVAFVIKDTCFNIKCKDYENCSLKSAISRHYNPRIVYVNWSPPRDNMGEGDIKYDYKGCWRDFDMSAFSIPLLEGSDAKLTGPYKAREDPVNDCATVSQRRGFQVFAVQNGGACFSGPSAEKSYKRYGTSEACKGGRGGAFANSVYKLFDDGSVMSLGCWADLQDRAFRRMEKIDPLLQDNYLKRADPIITCAKVAERFKIKHFALQKGGQCFIGKGDSAAYDKYGPSRKCKYGLGGQMANDVYFLKDTNTSEKPAISSDSTKPAAPASVKSPETSPTTDDIQVGETVYRVNDTDSDEIKYVYFADSVMKNVTLSSGISAGTFTDRGKIDSMDDCVKACGNADDCHLAFMLGKQCFSVSCYNVDVCHTKPAFSDYYQPQIAFVKHRVIKKSKKKAELVAGWNKPTPPSSCRPKNITDNVTLVEGINAGNFTDLGHVNDMNECVSRCCDEPVCEIAFKIEGDCYGVTCKSAKSCQTRIARNAANFRPAIAYVRDIGSRKVLTLPGQSKSIDPKPADKTATKSNCSSELWEGEVKENQTLVGGINAGEFTDHGQEGTIGECMSHCCMEKDCDLAFMIDKDCYTVKCKNPGLCRTRSARPTKFKPQTAFKKASEAGLTKAFDDIKDMFNDLTDVHDHLDVTFERPYFRGLTTQKSTLTSSVSPTTSKSTLTVIPRPPGTTPGFYTSTLMKSTSSAATPTFGDPLTKHSCEAGSIVYNATLKMGMHSGLFTKLGRVKRMDDCIERCCKSSNTDVAFMLGSMCFAVKCYSADLCKTVPVMISNIGNLNMNPAISFLKKKEQTMSSGFGGSDLDSIIEELSDNYEDFDKPKSQSLTSTELTTTNNLDVSSNNDTVGGEVHDLIRPIPHPTVVPGYNPTESCIDSPVNYNVTLKGGIHAGNFTEQGEGLTSRECVSKCCDASSCDLAFMFADRCYSVQCFSEEQCQAVLAKPSNLEPRIAYVTKNPSWYSDGTSFAVSTAVDTNPICDAANIQSGPIHVNKSLAGGLNSGNFTFMGQVRGMKDCLGKCCSANKCDLAYLIDSDCYAVKCFSPELCKVTSEPPKNGRVEISAVYKSERKPMKRESVAVYVVLGVLAFAVGIGGLVWAICMFMKRHRLKSKQNENGEEDPRPDR